MTSIGWWTVTQTVAHGFLQLLVVLTKWPVILCVIALVFFKYFRHSISHFIENGRFSAERNGTRITLESRQSDRKIDIPRPTESINELNANRENFDAAHRVEDEPRFSRLDNSIIDDVDASSPDDLDLQELSIGDTEASEGYDFDDLVRNSGFVDEARVIELRKEIDILRSQKQVADAMARHYYFLWLEGSLVMRTKAALKFVRDIGEGAISAYDFRSKLLEIADTGEVSAIESVLLSCGLLDARNGNFLISSSGEDFLAWRTASGQPALGDLSTYSQFS